MSRARYHMSVDRQQHEALKMQLRLRGSSLAQIARELDVARTSVTSVSLGLHRSRRIEAAIAARLGVTPVELWPDRYPAEEAANALLPAPARRGRLP